MKNIETLKFTHSAVITRNAKPCVSVMFERGNDVAEGIIPECTITKNKGFSSEEVRELEEYLHSSRKEIIESAKNISGFMNMFKKK